MRKSVSILVFLFFSAQAFSQHTMTREEKNKINRRYNAAGVAAGVITLVGSLAAFGFASADASNNKIGMGFFMFFSGIWSGLLIDDTQRLFNMNTKVAIYEDDQTTAKPLAVENLSEILQETEMAAELAFEHPDLAYDLPISDFAKAMNVSPHRLGQIIIKGKSIADRKLNSAKFASTPVSILKSELEASTGQLNPAELRIISNYLRSRNISVISF